MPRVKRAVQVSATVNGNCGTDHLNGEVPALHARIAELERERDAAEGFAALAAHELIAPLVLTEACVSLAGERLSATNEPEVLQAFEILGRGASRTRLLVEALLHDAGAHGRPLRRDPVDLDRLTRDCVSMLEPEIRTRRANVHVGPLPTVPGEVELLGGLMTNLLTNALKFSPRLGAVVTVSAAASDAGWTVYVESEGIPIPADDRERIFEPYSRGRGERRVRGAGLGLAICRRIAERHGGTIGIAETTADDGNRFFVTLPA